jgi:hypothetical protein
MRAVAHAMLVADLLAMRVAARLHRLSAKANTALT